MTIREAFVAGYESGAKIYNDRGPLDDKDTQDEGRAEFIIWRNRPKSATEIKLLAEIDEHKADIVTLERLLNTEITS